MTAGRRYAPPQTDRDGSQALQTFNDVNGMVEELLARTEGRVRMALPLGLGKATTIVNALTEAAIADSSISLDIFTALTLEKPVAEEGLEKRFLAPAMDRLFGDYPALKYAELLHQNRLPDNIVVSEFFLLAGRWLGVDRVQSNYVSANYTHAYEYLVDRQPNVVIQLLAREGDRYSLSCNPDITADLIADRHRHKLDFLFAGEINSELPFMSGEAVEIEEQDIDLLLDDPGSDFELFSAVKQPVDNVDMAIGQHVSTLIRDGGTLQIGIGSIGDAIAQSLLLRHRQNELWQEINRANPFLASGGDTGAFEEGLYASTEMLVDGLLQLFLADVLKREVDGAVIHAGFFVESRKFYEQLREMPEELRDKISMQPVSFTNDLYGDEQAKREARKSARFVNTAMKATLLGAVTSDGTGEGQVISGVGGQYNFVTQAFALAGGRSIITLRSTRKRRGITESNILWDYPHTTIPRHLKDIVVTEYGVADLRGKSDQETIAAMLSICDSRFQDNLLARARQEGKIDPNYRIPEAQRYNTPEQLADWITPLRDDKVLSPFPFGTDFTQTEQRLLSALSLLKQAKGSNTELARLALAGMGRASSPEEKDCLERMELHKPGTMKERAYALALRGALRNALSD